MPTHDTTPAGDSPRVRLLAALTKTGIKARRNGSCWQSACPAHADDGESLRIGESADGSVIFDCAIGCRPEAVCAALGMRLGDLKPSDGARVEPPAEPTPTSTSPTSSKARTEPPSTSPKDPTGRKTASQRAAELMRALRRKGVAIRRAFQIPTDLTRLAAIIETWDPTPMCVLGYPRRPENVVRHFVLSHYDDTGTEPSIAILDLLRAIDDATELPETYQAMAEWIRDFAHRAT